MMNFRNAGSDRVPMRRELSDKLTRALKASCAVACGGYINDRQSIVKNTYQLISTQYFQVSYNVIFCLFLEPSLL